MNKFKDYNLDEYAKKIRKNFPIFKGDKNFIFLDNASTTQKPQEVINAIKDFYSNYNSNVHRAFYSEANKATKKLEEVRESVKEFINAPSKENVIFTSGASEGISIVANSLILSYLKDGDEIITSILEHNSNIAPWLYISKIKNIKIKFAEYDENLEITTESIKKLINEKTKLIALSHVSNIFGTKQNIEEVINLARERKIVTLIDSAQAIPSIKIDVKKLKCDFLVFSAHKMLGPTGVGVLYISNNFLDMESAKVGGNTIENFIWQKNKLKYELLKAPNRFEAGTPNISGIIGFGEAIKYINSLESSFIENYKKHIGSYTIESLREIKGLKILLSKKYTSNFIIPIKIENIHSHDIAMYLASKGIATRAGKNCAYLAFDSLKEKDLLRISIYIYNTTDEIDTLKETLNKIIKYFK